MAKGSVINLDFHSFTDPGTGARVTRLTPPEVLCHRNYFYQKCFTQDGRQLLFAAEFDGHRNYYLLDRQQRQAVQLTEGAGDNTFGGFLSPDDRFLYYVKNERELRRVTLSTQEESTVYRVPEEWVGYGTWVANSECTSLVGIEIDRRDWMPLTDWQVFHTFFTKNHVVACCASIFTAAKPRLSTKPPPGSGIQFTVPMTIAAWRSAMRGRTIGSTPACG
ncbi:putative oligogalacturonide lyase [Serratia odorifera DSM 4582]|uniref:Putative oligogalacturonide lyase n=1 Tax=Serratia odorifera DSM 4582 TaxID=667129 RepID=D4E446_SEROD|nr:putative oligogalacturonide lyase [Serratia odorifera DSM 4582]